MKLNELFEEDEEETEPSEEELEEFRFGLKDDSNIKAVKSELRKFNVDFEEQKEGDTTFFQMNSQDEHDKALGHAEKVIDKSKEQ